MKKLLLSTFLIFGIQFVVSQNIYDALRYSNNDVEGSARFSAMSGAFGALGGELSAISINPAGSTIFTKDMASITFGNHQTKNNTELTNNILNNEGFYESQAIKLVGISNLIIPWITQTIDT